MNIRQYLDDSHPDLSLVSDGKKIDRIFLDTWGVHYPGYAGAPPSPLANDVEKIQVNDAYRSHKDCCPIGLAICTWNRPRYLETCLRSVKQCDLSAVIIVIVDDASGDADTLGLIRDFDIESPLIKVYKTRRRQIHHSLDLAWCLLRGIGCRFLANLDADAIVAPSWLDALQSLHQRLDNPDRTILSPFNKCGDASIIEEAEDYRIKKELGGICYFFGSEMFSSIRPCLCDVAWDGLVSSCFAGWHAEGYRLICTRPSYVQHIGVIGMNSGPGKQFDHANDFVGTPPILVTGQGRRHAC